MVSRRPPGRPGFGRYVVVDWSAAATPRRGADSIWLAVLDADSGPGDGVRLENPSTRHEAMSTLGELVADGVRTLIGVDVSLGYPRGSAAAFGLSGDTPMAATWAMLADSVVDDARNRNNRFEVASGLNAMMASGPGPFWGCSASRASPTLTRTRPLSDPRWPPEWRHVENVMRSEGHRPFTVWQLLGAGSVGGQTLVGVAALERFRRARTALGPVAVWPFDTGLTVPSQRHRVVVAEVWPSLWPVEVPDGAIKDEVQVTSTVQRLHDADLGGVLDDWFRPALSSAVASEVVCEEGWVLGVGCDAASDEKAPWRR